MQPRRLIPGPNAPPGSPSTNRLIFFDGPLGARCRESGMDSFDALWSLEGPRVESANARRGGSSEVLHAALPLPMFIKRQHNQLRRAALSVYRARPTYWFEWRLIEYANARGAFGPRLLCYAERRSAEDWYALLATEPLPGFESLERLIGSLAPADRARCLRRVGALIARLHALRIEHGALYPKHIFIRSDGDFEVRLIDFERARFRRSPGAAARRDVARFFRRAAQLDALDRRSFERGYEHGG